MPAVLDSALISLISRFFVGLWPPQDDFASLAEQRKIEVPTADDNGHRTAGLDLSR